MKRIFYLLPAFFLCARLFAYEGLMAGQKELKSVRTEHFDIIFAPDSAAAAKVLAENADRLFDELAEKLGLVGQFRMPVVISPGQDEFNAYFSWVPFNHIVMYDTVPAENLAVFSETLLMTFRHELTHAITFNVKNRFWYRFDRIFGDLYNPGLLTATKAWSEGAAVLMESEGTEGRLHDEYTLHIIRQAKIEGCFPKYTQIQGARDIFPTGDLYYHFGGAFSAYLQQKYGMEKYADFWFRCVNLKTLTYIGCFKKVYGVPIKQAWQDFADSVEAPDVPADPTENGWCGDFFTDFLHSSDQNRRNLRFKSLASCSGAFAFADTYGSAVYLCERKDARTESAETAAGVDAAGVAAADSAESADGVPISNGAGRQNAAADVPPASIGAEYQKPRRLFSLPNITKIALSDDGRYMAVSFLSGAGKLPVNRVRIYDLKKRRFFSVEEKSLRDAAIVRRGGDYYLAAVKTQSQFVSVKFYRLRTDSRGKLTAAEFFDEIKMRFGDAAYSLSADGNGNFVWIHKDGLRFSLRGYTPADGARFGWTLPEERMVIRNIAPCAGYAGKSRLIFSWTKPGTMPRLGFAELSENGAAYDLQGDDVSGGVYRPVMLDGGMTAYSGCFYHGEKLLTANPAEMKFSRFSGKALSSAETGGAAAAGTGVYGAKDADAGGIKDSGKNPAARSVKADGAAVPGGRADNSGAENDAGNSAGTAAAYGAGAGFPAAENGAAFSGAESGRASGGPDGAQKYNPLRHLRGTIVPVGLINTCTIDRKNGSLDKVMLPLGVTYMSSTPWNSPSWNIAAGFNPATASAGIAATVQGGTSTALLKYAVTAQIEFDGDGYKQTCGTANFSSKIPTFGHFYIRAAERLEFLEGRQSLTAVPAGKSGTLLTYGILRDKNSRPQIYVSNRTALAFGNIHEAGAGYYEAAGAELAVRYDFNAFALTGDFDLAGKNYQNIGADFGIRIPHILPLVCDSRTTFNMPAQLDFSLFPTRTRFVNTGASVILFSRELQRTPAFLPLLYFNRFTVKLHYLAKFNADDNRHRSWSVARTGRYFSELADGGTRYYDEMGLNFSLSMTPDIGMMADPSAQFSLTAALKYSFRPEPDDKAFSIALIGATVF